MISKYLPLKNLSLKTEKVLIDYLTMKVVTIISSDRLTLGMFTDFLKSIYWKAQETKAVDVNCLLSDTFQVSNFGDTLKLGKNTLARYFLEKNFVLKLPPIFTEKSDLVLHFIGKSMVPVVLEDKTKFSASVLERWETNVKKLSAQ